MCVEVEKFRQLCRGRSWVPDTIYNVLYIIRHTRGADRLWTKLPKCFVRHQDETILKNLRTPIDSPEPSAWCQALSHIQYVEHPEVTRFHEQCGDSGDPSFKTIQQMLTVIQPQWKEYWTFMGWSCRRKKRRHIEKLVLCQGHLNEEVLQAITRQTSHYVS